MSRPLDYYSCIAKSYNELYADEQESKLSRIKRLSGCVLDIGSGTGLSARRFPGIIQMDPSFAMLKKAGGLRVCGVAEKLPFKEAIFDIVISFTALHHIRIEATINEIKRVSKKKACFAFSILKCSKDFNKIVHRLKKNFKLEELDDEKDTILVSSRLHL